MKVDFEAAHTGCRCWAVPGALDPHVEMMAAAGSPAVTPDTLTAPDDHLDVRGEQNIRDALKADPSLGRKPWESLTEWQQRMAQHLGFVGGRDYWHVVPAGTDLSKGILTYNALIKAGITPGGSGEFRRGIDPKVVSLHSTAGEAARFNAELMGGQGTVVVVHVPESAKLGINAEGYPVRYGNVPAAWLR